MAMNPTTVRLQPAEEAFLRALLWEEAHLVDGPATKLAKEHGLSLIRCLEPINRLVANFQGEALNRLGESSCSPAEWPWEKLTADEVLRLFWARLADFGARPGPTERGIGLDAPGPRADDLGHTTSLERR